MQLTDQEWKDKLTDDQYGVLRNKGTEAPFTGKHLNEKRAGVFVCAACGTELFNSNTKFESGSGWPSFYDVAKKGTVELRDDSSQGMQRTEVVCTLCGGHLGHLFDDGPVDKTGKRYCINSIALEFKPKADQ